MLGAQGVGLGLLVGIGGHRLLARQQVDGGLAALLGRQVVAGAAQEDPGGGGADLHLAPAGGAVDVGGHRLVGAHALLALGHGELLLELGVEGIEQRLPVALALGHLVEAVLHARGEGVVHQVRERLLEPLGDDVAELLGVEAPVLQPDVAAVLDGGDDRGVGGGPADAPLLQLLDQARLGVARRRLGEVLARVKRLQGHGGALGEVRQRLVLLLAPHGLHHPGVAVELQHPALGAQLVAVDGHGQGGGEVLGRGHLAGHELAPDQLVEALGVALHAGQVGGPPGDVGGTDRLVGLLGALLAGVAIGRLGQVARAVLVADEVAHALHRVLREVGGVGTHVGDVARLVEALGQGHGLLHREAQPATGGLLQGRGDEGRIGLGAGRLVLATGDGKARLAQAGDALQGLGLGGGPEGLAILARQFEAHRLAGLGHQVGVDVPELLGDEGADLALALDDQAHGHRLHAPRGEAPGDLGPQQRREHEAHHPVEEAPRLLGLHPRHVEVAGVLEGLLDGALGDLVEDHAPIAPLVAADGLAQVPGDRLPLAVKVGGEIDGVGLGGQLLELGDHLLLAGQDLVVGLPAVLGVDAHAADQLIVGLALPVLGLLLRRHLAGRRGLAGTLLGVGGRLAGAAGRQVADMAHARLHDEVVAEVLVDRLRLGRRLDDDQ